MASKTVGAARLAARGAELEFYRTGSGERILVLHGAKDFRGWHAYHDKLAARYKVLAPVHPGFGTSERSPEIESVDDLAYFYLDLIDQLSWARVHLFGIGVGGWIAAELAVRSCAPLMSLTLVDAVGIKVSGPDQADITDIYAMPEDERLGLLWHDPSVADDIVGNPKTMDPEDLEVFLRNEETETLYTWKPYMHNPALRKRLHRVRVPTLVLWGARDRVVAPSYGEAFAQAIPNARFVTIEQAAHLPHLEQPAAFADQVLRFVDEVGR